MARRTRSDSDFEPARQRGRARVGGYRDDASITTKVEAVILANAGLKVFEIHIVTDKDIVQLSGLVDSSSMVGSASDVAGQVAGIRGVRRFSGWIVQC